MAVKLTADDLLRWDSSLTKEQAEELVEEGLAMAASIAPCIMDDDFAFAQAAKAIIRSACLRWAASGSGGISSEQKMAGPYQTLTSYQSSSRRSLFYPSEITALEKLCKDNTSQAFAFDTIALPNPRCGADCGYGFGSTGSACPDCANTLNPTWRRQ
ncbi:hypothetical protein [Corynebacterium sp. TAE3-ERU2]|uniref:hypothetical protein n=1 Tax=Corynebacterium sp. TAE3-ERU2 TaxID=2849497 RepID=UPI001C490B87|nr:hypothetical protein [Corynebacterium sp. TAE3-ERU2]MBV7302930.1 hypothetical protein [Corynebacterium sp. TAE3-ERU2]